MSGEYCFCDFLNLSRFFEILLDILRFFAILRFLAVFSFFLLKFVFVALFWSILMSGLTRFTVCIEHGECTL